MRRNAALILVILAVLSVGACGSKDSSSSTTPAASPTVAESTSPAVISSPTSSPATTGGIMPDLTGMTWEEATAATAAAFAYYSISSAYEDSTETAGTVIGQEPAAGTAVVPDKNNSISVVVTIAQ